MWPWSGFKVLWGDDLFGGSATCPPPLIIARSPERSLSARGRFNNRLRRFTANSNLNKTQLISFELFNLPKPTFSPKDSSHFFPVSPDQSEMNFQFTINYEEWNWSWDLSYWPWSLLILFYLGFVKLFIWIWGVDLKCLLRWKLFRKMLKFLDGFVVGMKCLQL